MIPQLTEKLGFPDPREAKRGEFDGLVAVGGDLSVERLLLAYRSGIFPWSVRPITWWSPDPRGIFDLNHIHISRSLGRVLRQRPYQVTVDQAFRQVIQACATAPRRDQTWISREFVSAYSALHDAGHAHSVECWHSGELVGGIYGVNVGGLFAGESMFHRADNASKVALIHLADYLRQRGFQLFDIQMVTPATEQLAAIEISREEYLRRLTTAVAHDVTF